MPAPRTFTPTSTDPLRARLGNPFVKAMKAAEENERRSVEFTFAAKESEAGIILITFAHSSCGRLELAREYSRRGIVAITPDKSLFRHTLKQQVKALQKDIDNYDISIGRLFSDNEAQLDLFDKFYAGYAEHPEVCRLSNTLYFSILQWLTAHGVQHDTLLATWLMADYLTAYAYLRFCDEWRANKARCPALNGSWWMVPAIEVKEVHRVTETLLNRFAPNIPRGDDFLVCDENIKRGYINLIALLSDWRRIKKQFQKK